MSTRICKIESCENRLRQEELESAMLACFPCIDRIRCWLEELPTQVIVLEGSRQRDVTGERGRSGTRTAPLPGREEVLNLLGPAAWTAVRDSFGDQCGTTPIVGVLSGWVMFVCEQRRWNGPYAPTSENLAAWLAKPRVLDWMARQEAVAHMYRELAELMCAIRDITRVRPRRRAVCQPCPRCDALGLVETDHEAYTHCTLCESRFTRPELALAARITVAELGAA